MLHNKDFRLRFWGVRGSLPSPGLKTALFGGNTACVELRVGEDLIVFDMGSGVRELGNLIVKEQIKTFHIFISHYHFDHIMGFPFFSPAYRKGYNIHVYGEDRERQSVEAILSHLMQYPYFPVTKDDEMKAHFTFHSVTPASVIDINGTTVSMCPLNHPGGVMSYRVESEHKSVVYATDTEHFKGKQDPNLIRLAKDTNMLIYDAMYTDEQYHGVNGLPPHEGWGHSTWQEAIKIAKKAKARQLCLFHHDIARSDDDISIIEKEAQKHFKNTFAAREGIWFPVNE